jgi:hypothetical protein
MKELPKREFDLNEVGYFFLSNSFRIHKGIVIGYWINPSDDGEQYYYQLQYEVEQTDNTMGTRWATIPAKDIFRKEPEAIKTFTPLKKERMEEALRMLKVNLEANEVTKTQATENIEEIKGEQERLLKEYGEEFGEYVEKVEENKEEEISDKKEEVQ